MYVCVYACMYGCEQSLNDICAQLGVLRCKIHVVVFLGEPNTENLCLCNTYKLCYTVYQNKCL